MTSNQPVRFLRRQPIVRMPILSLDFIRAQVRFSMERDLSKAPTPLSGGDRKAMHKAENEQRRMLCTPRRIAREPWYGLRYDTMIFTCPRCHRSVLFENDPDDPSEMTCLRCDNRPPSRWERVLG